MFEWNLGSFRSAASPSGTTPMLWREDTLSSLPKCTTIATPFSRQTGWILDCTTLYNLNQSASIVQSPLSTEMQLVIMPFTLIQHWRMWFYLLCDSHVRLKDLLNACMLQSHVSPLFCFRRRTRFNRTCDSENCVGSARSTSRKLLGMGHIISLRVIPV